MYNKKNVWNNGCQQQQFTCIDEDDTTCTVFSYVLTQT